MPRFYGSDIQFTLITFIYTTPYIAKIYCLYSYIARKKYLTLKDFFLFFSLTANVLFFTAFDAMIAHPPSLDSRCCHPISVAVDQFMSSSINSGPSSPSHLWPAVLVAVACPLPLPSPALLVAASCTLAQSPPLESLPARCRFLGRPCPSTCLDGATRPPLLARPPSSPVR
jgi:hypothetical protein